MSRFYLSLKEAPKVIIEYSKDLEYSCRPLFESVFGIAFIEAKEVNGDILRYEFIPDYPEDAEVIRKAFFPEDRIVKEIDATINLN
jgi:hypothetical protein